MGIKEIRMIFLFLSLCMLFAGCSNVKQVEDQDTVNNETVGLLPVEIDENEIPKGEDLWFESKGDGLIVHHGMGTVHIPLNPRKIAVFDLGLLDTVLTFGHDFTYITSSAKNLPECLGDISPQGFAGHLKEPDIQMIREFEPEIIFISTRMADYYDSLSEIAPVVYSRIAGTSKDFLEEMRFNTRLIAALFGEEDRAETMLANQAQRMKAVRKENEEGKKTSALVMTDERGIHLYDDRSVYAFVYDEFGFAFPLPAKPKESHGQRVGLEEMQMLEVDYIFLFDRTVAIGEESPAADKVRNDLLAAMDEKTTTVTVLDAPTWYLAPNGINGYEKVITEIENALR